MNRFALLVFCDKNGSVRRYAHEYIKFLQEICSKVLVIANGHIQAQDELLLTQTGVIVLKRQNIGYDFSAWRVGIEYLTEKNILREADELLLSNFTCYGPIHPLAPVFTRMENEACDFWGMTWHTADAPVLPHLQSYFLVIRQKMLQHQCFADYFHNIQEAHTRAEAFAQEVQFTQYFLAKGFVAKAAFGEGQEHLLPWCLAPNPTVLLGDLLLKEGFPFLKRKVFLEDYSHFAECSEVLQAANALKYIQENSQYPVEYIYEDFMATMPVSKIREKLHLNFVIGNGSKTPPKKHHATMAVIVYSYFEKYIEYILTYLKNLPQEASVFIVVCSRQMELNWKEKSKLLSNAKIEIRIQPNRGRNETAYWIICKDVFPLYDYVCLLHDKETPSSKPLLKGYEFSENCWNGLLNSPSFITDVIDVFESNPRIGMLYPPPSPCVLKDIPNNEYGPNLQTSKELYKTLQLTVPFDTSPTAPWGSMFWLRSKAILPLFRKDWKIEDFPQEPLPPDGTLLHALERVYPMIAHEAGYLTGYITSHESAMRYYDSVYYFLKIATSPESRKRTTVIYFLGLPLYKEEKLGRAKTIQILGLNVYSRYFTNTEEKVKILGVPFVKTPKQD